MMACCMAVAAYAQPWTITYVLPPGAVTNDYGWQCKGDMLAAFNADWNKFYNVPSNDPFYTWDTMEQLMLLPTVLERLNRLALMTARGNVMWGLLNDPTGRWLWLQQHIRNVNAAYVPGAGLLPPQPLVNNEVDGHFAWRFNVAAFFVNGKRPSWPVSPDYSIAGTIEAFQPVWKAGFDGPPAYNGTRDIALPAPFMEGKFFLGWFTAPNGGGDRMAIIPQGTTGNLRLYAHFVDPVLTPADIAGDVAAERIKPGDEVMSIGVVTFIADNTIFLQAPRDGSAMTVDFAALPADVAVGRELIVEGTVTASGNAFVLTDATIVVNDAGTLPVPTDLVMLSTLDANRFRFVYYQGLTIIAVSGNAVTVADGMEATTTLIAELPAGMSVGTRINLTGVVSYNGTTTGLMASTANIALAPAAVPDPSTYTPRTFGQGDDAVTFELEGKWLISVERGNLIANPVTASLQASRSMVAKDGRMYFPDRIVGGGEGHQDHGVVVVNAATGERIKRINFRNSDVFRNAGGAPLGFSFNDLKLDCKGNFVSSNLATSSASIFQIWVLDMENITNSRMLLNTTLTAEMQRAGITAFDARIDYIDAFGDMNGDGFIMAAGGNSNAVFKWTVEDSEIVKFETIRLDMKPAITGMSIMSSAAFIYIVDENRFFIDTMNGAVGMPAGEGTPVLFNMNGELIDGFHNILDPVVRAAVTPHHTPVGVTEFSLRGDHFLITVHGNTSDPPTDFYLFKYADDNKKMADMIPMWRFPEKGMGVASNPSRTAIPAVIVDEEAGIATIHLWYVEVGYGVFEFRSDRQPPSSIPQVPADAVVNMAVNGNTVIMDREVAQISVFNVTGQLVAVGINSNAINIPANGVFLVRAITHDGQTAVERVIIR